MCVFRCDGVLYDCVDDQILNRQRDSLNQIIRAFAKPELALWCTTMHEIAPELDDVANQSPNTFAQRLKHNYWKSHNRERLYTNQWYISVILNNTLKTRSTQKAVAPDDCLHPTPQQREEFEQLCMQIEDALKTYTPKKLTQCEATGTCELMTYLSQLLNQEKVSRRRPINSINNALLIKDVISGWETMEVRGTAEFRLIAALGIREYPAKTYIGQLDQLLRANFEWTLTQSFTVIPQKTAIAMLQHQAKRLFNANDPAYSQQEALKKATDALSSNEFILGDHHLSLIIKTEPRASHIAENYERAQRELSQHIGEATNLFAQAGIICARENLALEAAYWAQLPGNHRFRPRVAPLTSRNIAGLISMHAHPRGPTTTNPWGEALIPLKTTSLSRYQFSLHPPTTMAEVFDTPANKETSNRTSTTLTAAHTFICGPTGSGKTVFAAILISLISDRNIKQVVFDKDRGLANAIGALNGRYEVFKLDGGTNLNPLLLEDNQINQQFLVRWLSTLMPQIKAQKNWEHTLGTALAGVYQLPPTQRRLSRLREFFDPTEEVGVYQFLERWCRSTNGVYADLFDSETDNWQALFKTSGLLGIDMTDCLKNDDIREPISSYLFHLIDQSLDQMPTLVWIDEFSSFIKDNSFREFVENACRTWRKRNGVLALLTQSPSDVAESDIARTLIEQIPTRIFFPNANAQKQAYCELYGLNDREYYLISKKLTYASRQFLIKQPLHSVVAELDLKDLADELKILTSRN